jgi:5,10-methylene-tetrahydrofolate dehydrogenase/methenyl tetrahydrofolate cyclohydrolase
VIVYFSVGHSHTHFTYVVTGRSISMITVVGATGNVGRPLAESLIEAGEPVRVTTRSAEKAHAFAGRADVAVIDFDQPDTLRAAFHGSRKAFIGLGTSGRQVQDEVNAAGLNPAVVDIFLGLDRMTRDNLMADIALRPRPSSAEPPQRWRNGWTPPT